MIFQPVSDTPGANGRTPTERENESPDTQRQQGRKPVQKQGGQGQEHLDEADRAPESPDAEQGMAGREGEEAPHLP